MQQTMSNLTLKQQFKELLDKLMDPAQFNYKAARIAREAKISIYKINAIVNRRPVTVDKDMLDRLRAYYEKKKNDNAIKSAPLAEELALLLAENASLREELKRLDAEYRKRIEELEKEMLVLKKSSNGN